MAPRTTRRTTTGPRAAADGVPDPATPPTGPTEPETVASLAALYLGNILYALEATALGFDQESKGDHAAFYRAIARRLAEARGREKA